MPHRSRPASVDWNFEETSCSLKKTEKKSKWVKGSNNPRICLASQNTIAYVSGSAIKFVSVLGQSRKSSMLWLQKIRMSMKGGRRSIVAERGQLGPGTAEEKPKDEDAVSTTSSIPGSLLDQVDFRPALVDDMERKARNEEMIMKGLGRTMKNTVIPVEHKGVLQEVLFAPPANGIGLLTSKVSPGLFAFTELCIKPTIYIYWYKTLKVASVLKGGAELDYKAIAFAGKDFFIAVSGVPNFQFLLWKWSSRERLLTIETSINHEELQLVPNTTQWTTICQWSRKTLSIWEVQYFDHSSTASTKELQLPLADVTIVGVGWGPLGELFVASTLAYIFKIEFVPDGKSIQDLNIHLHPVNRYQDTDFDPDLNKCIIMYNLRPDVFSNIDNVDMLTDQGNNKTDHDEEYEKGITTMVMVENNIAIFTKEGLMLSLKTDKTEVEKRGYEDHTVLQAFLGDKETIIAKTGDGEIVLISGVDIASRSFVPDLFASSFFSACFIRPHCLITAGLTRSGRLYLWHTEDGTLEAFFNLDVKCCCMAANPQLSYLTIGTENGNVLICSALPEIPPNMVHRAYLTLHPIDKLDFIGQGCYLLAGNAARGLLYVMRAQPTRCFEYLDCCWARGSIHSICDMGNNEEVKVAILVCAQGISSPDRIILFKMDSENVLQVMVIYNLDFTCRGLYFCKNRSAFCTYLDSCREIGMYFPDAKEEHILELTNLFKIDAGQHIDIILQSADDMYYFFANDGTLFRMIMGQPDSCRAYTRHHYTTGGIVHGDVTSKNTGFLTVGGDGIVTFTDLRQTDAETHCADLSRSQWEFINHENIILEHTDARTDFTPMAHEMTVLQILEQEQHHKQQQQYEEQVKYIRRQVDNIRHQVVQLLDNNSRLVDFEQLPLHEFEMDLEEERKVWTEGLGKVNQMEAQMQANSMANHLVAQKIKELCWDRMEVKAQRIKTFNSSLEVPNFQLAFPSAQDAETLQTTKLLRDIEKELESMQEAFTENDIIPLVRDVYAEDEEEEPLQPTDTQLVLPSSLSHTLIPKNIYLYEQLELISVFRMHLQITLLKETIHQLQVSFNKSFDQLMQQKQYEMNIITERNVRIRYILNELNRPEDAAEIKNPKWSMLEKPENRLEVMDDEIKAQPYISPEERKRREKLAAEEAERRRREAEDNFRERALIVMMDGVLEKRREDELKKDIPKPAFMLNKTIEEFTDEEMKLYKEYEKKVIELNEEREKYRKQLESELTNLQEANESTKAGFDERLLQLFQMKLKYDACHFQEEINMARLNLLIQNRNILESKENMIIKHIHKLQEDMRFEHITLAEFESVLEKDQKVFDGFVSLDKMYDVTFKKEFKDVTGTEFDVLLRIFKKRPKEMMKMQRSTEYLHLILEALTKPREELNQQYGDKGQRILQMLEELDDVIHNMPEGMEHSMWHNFCKMRRAKIQSETQVKVAALEMAERRTLLWKKKVQNDRHSNIIKETFGVINSIRDIKEESARDLQLQFVIKQGQLELVPCNELAHFNDAVMVDRAVVEKINELIKGRGEVKLQAMTRSKNFRQAIMALEWEHERSEMEIEDLLDKKNSLIRLKVTREVQDFLTSEDYQSKQARIVSKLDESIKMIEEQHKKRIDRNKALKKELKGQARGKNAINTEFNTMIKAAQVDVTEMQLERDPFMKQKKDEGMKRRMKIILQRSKLIREIDCQHDQLLSLQEELNKLRKKCLPYFQASSD